jgi:hypothetical protein
MQIVPLILLNTPWWVFALFAMLTVLGVQALRDRTLPVWRVLITPLVFCGWGLESLVVRSLDAPILLAAWLITCSVAGALAYALTRLHTLRISHAERTVWIAGSPFPLLRNLLIFFAKYGLGIAGALAPALRPELAIMDVAVSGASAGYFIAWMIRFASLYRRSGVGDLVAEAPL